MPFEDFLSADKVRHTESPQIDFTNPESFADFFKNHRGDNNDKLVQSGLLPKFTLDDGNTDNGPKVAEAVPSDTTGSGDVPTGTAVEGPGPNPPDRRNGGLLGGTPVEGSQPVTETAQIKGVLEAINEAINGKPEPFPMPVDTSVNPHRPIQLGQAEQAHPRSATVIAQANQPKPMRGGHAGAAPEGGFFANG